MHWADYLSDEEMLCRATIREEELERTVRELERSASELERERDAAYVWEHTGFLLRFNRVDFQGGKSTFTTVHFTTAQGLPTCAPDRRARTGRSH